MAEVFRWQAPSARALGFELEVETHGDGLRVCVWDDNMEGTFIDLDRAAAEDLVNQLESWRAGWMADRG